MDVVLALHACGAATDLAMQQAARNRAAFVVSPCCIGKIGATAAALSGMAGDGSIRALPPLQHPRSEWMRRSMTAPALPVSAADDTSPSSPASDVQTSTNHAAEMQAAPGAAWPPALPVAAAQVQQQYEALARAADYSHRDLAAAGSSSSYSHTAVLAKSNLELDRAQAMAEEGYATAMVRLLQPSLTSKVEVLVGVPHEACGRRFSWPWLL